MAPTKNKSTSSSKTSPVTKKIRGIYWHSDGRPYVRRSTSVAKKNLDKGYDVGYYRCRYFGETKCPVHLQVNHNTKDFTITGLPHCTPCDTKLVKQVSDRTKEEIIESCDPDFQPQSTRYVTDLERAVAIDNENKIAAAAPVYPIVPPPPTSGALSSDTKNKENENPALPKDDFFEVRILFLPRSTFFYTRTNPQLLFSVSFSN